MEGIRDVSGKNSVRERAELEAREAQRPAWRFGSVFGSWDTKQMACFVWSVRFSLWPCFIMHTHTQTQTFQARGGMVM